MNTFARIAQLKVIAASLFLAFACASSCLAQTYVVTISGSTPNLGTVVSSASSPDSVWRINPSTQAVTQQSGSAVRLSTNLSRATVTISCAGSCAKGDINVQVGTNGSPSNRARALTNFTVAMGSATQTVAVSGTNPISFAIGPTGGSPKTFYVGADFAIAPDSSNLGTGVSTSGFYVSVGKAPATNQASGTGSAVATVYRPISIGQTQALDFGTIVRPRPVSSNDGPTTGSISISKSPTANPVYTITGGGVLLTPTAAKRGIITISGEGGATISISPSTLTSFNLTGPSTIPVTLDTDLVTPTTLSGNVGDTLAGTKVINIGASFSYSDATPSGSYNGNFSITASYN